MRSPKMQGASCPFPPLPTQAKDRRRWLDRLFSDAYVRRPRVATLEPFRELSSFALLVAHGKASPHRVES